MNVVTQFINFPALEFPLTEFKYPAFSMNEINSEFPAISFPSELMLGKQAEYIFEHYLEHSKQYQIISSNTQIQGVTETLGELDYIIFDRNNNHYTHVELACKFYLLDTDLGPNIAEQWIGPNRKDRLLDKLEKLSNRQFPLLHHKQTNKLLDKLKIRREEIKQQLCLKASLFLPQNKPTTTLPKHYLDCVAGTYLKSGDINSIYNEHSIYALPTKKEWLLSPESLDNWSSFSEIKEKVKLSIANKRSPLLYKKTGEIVEKIFVVWW